MSDLAAGRLLYVAIAPRHLANRTSRQNLQKRVRVVVSYLAFSVPAVLAGLAVHIPQPAHHNDRLRRHGDLPGAAGHRHRHRPPHTRRLAIVDSGLLRRPGRYRPFPPGDAGFPVIFRFSQWKGWDFGARPADTPGEPQAVLAPIVDAGVNAFPPSTRRSWEPAFEGSDLNLAAWARKLTGKAGITVGSVGGLADPEWARKVLKGWMEGFVSFTAEAEKTLSWPSPAHVGVPPISGLTDLSFHSCTMGSAGGPITWLFPCLSASAAAELSTLRRSPPTEHCST
ncbi:hypothetical protein [Streptomyces sp. NPDC059909]|uniref:hypothetical protein n=1 Tax=Streptomyces sp. NPDC059909 TaxID=3346998 RepID=UPI003669D425